MTFLSKVGKFLSAGVLALTGLAPFFQQFFGAKVATGATTATNDLTAIGSIVIQAEALLQTPGSGAAKLAAAAPLVANIVKTSELVSGHQIANNALFIQGCTDLTNAVAEILNSLSANGVQSQGTTVAPIPPISVSPVPVALSAPPAPPAPNK
jgi:hypothetical protein